MREGPGDFPGPYCRLPTALFVPTARSYRWNGVGVRVTVELAPATAVFVAVAVRVNVAPATVLAGVADGPPIVAVGTGEAAVGEGQLTVGDGMHAEVDARRAAHPIDPPCVSRLQVTRPAARPLSGHRKRRKTRSGITEPSGGKATGGRSFPRCGGPWPSPRARDRRGNARGKSIGGKNSSSSSFRGIFIPFAGPAVIRGELFAAAWCRRQYNGGFIRPKLTRTP
jgi:hypothetical protein